MIILYIYVTIYLYMIIYDYIYTIKPGHLYSTSPLRRCASSKLFFTIDLDFFLGASR